MQCDFLWTILLIILIIQLLNLLTLWTVVSINLITLWTYRLIWYNIISKLHVKATYITTALYCHQSLVSARHFPVYHSLVFYCISISSPIIICYNPLLYRHFPLLESFIPSEVTITIITISWWHCTQNNMKLVCVSNLNFTFQYKMEEKVFSYSTNSNQTMSSTILHSARWMV